MYRKLVRFIRQFKPFDRRRDIRYVAHPALECVCVYVEAGKRLECPSYIKNISKGGVLVATGEDKIYPGTEVEIRFQLAGQGETHSVHGKVVRTYRKQYKSRHYSGIQFHNKEEEGIQLLLDFVSKQS